MDGTRRSIDHIAANCIAVRLRMLNRVVTNAYDKALRPYGVRTSQLNILVATAKLGVAKPAQVCDFLQLEPSTLSRNVNRMRTAGWLEIVPGPDARSQSFRLTAQGRRLIEKVVPAWAKGQRKAAALLGEEGLALLDRVARRVSQAGGT